MLGEILLIGVSVTVVDIFVVKTRAYCDRICAYNQPHIALGDLTAQA